MFTHAYGDRAGVRWLSGGLKVYYAPRLPINSQASRGSEGGYTRDAREHGLEAPEYPIVHGWCIGTSRASARVGFGNELTACLSGTDLSIATVDCTDNDIMAQYCWASASMCLGCGQAWTPPTIFGGFRLLRAVLLRERITLVHTHQAFSAIAHEAIIHGRTMGYKVRRGTGVW